MRIHYLFYYILYESGNTVSLFVAKYVTYLECDMVRWGFFLIEHSKCYLFDVIAVIHCNVYCTVWRYRRVWIASYQKTCFEFLNESERKLKAIYCSFLFRLRPFQIFTKLSVKVGITCSSLLLLTAQTLCFKPINQDIPKYYDSSKCQTL